MNIHASIRRVSEQGSESEWTIQAHYEQPASERGKHYHVEGGDKVIQSS